MASWDGFSEAWATFDTGKWGRDNATRVTVTGGVLNINVPATTNDYWEAYTLTAFDLTGCRVSCQLVSDISDDASGNAFCVLGLADIQNPKTSDFLGWETDGGGIDPEYRVGGAATYPGGGFTHTDGNYYAIRESGGTIYWEWSTDGSSWTVAVSASIPAGIDVTSLYLALQAGGYSTGATSIQNAQFDNVLGQIPPPDPWPAIAWGTIVASVDASAPFIATGSLPSHQTDDILIACAAKNDASNLTCATSGWASIIAAQNSANFSSGWFWKRATSSAEAAPVITSSTTGSASAGIYVTCGRIRGCIKTGTPFEDATLAGTPTNNATPLSSLITTVGTNRLAVAIALIDDNNTISSGYPPATWATGVNTGSDTGGDSKCLAISKPVAAAGNVAAVTIGTQAASDYWKSLTLAFIPEPVALASKLKRWNGSTWVVANLKHGASWDTVPLDTL